MSFFKELLNSVKEFIFGKQETVLDNIELDKILEKAEQDSVKNTEVVVEKKKRVKKATSNTVKATKAKSVKTPKKATKQPKLSVVAK